MEETHVAPFQCICFVYADNCEAVCYISACSGIGADWHDCGGCDEGALCNRWAADFDPNAPAEGDNDGDDGDAYRIETEGEVRAHCTYHQKLKEGIHMTHTTPHAPLTGCRAIPSTPETSRTYSSVLNNDAIGTGHARSALDSPQAWSANLNAAGQWLQFDLGAKHAVQGVVVQNDVNHWVSRYIVKYSVDHVSWAQVAGQFTCGGARSVRTESIFPAAVPARYVRLTVLEWFGRISMRADAILDCGTLQQTTPNNATPQHASARTPCDKHNITIITRKCVYKCIYRRAFSSGRLFADTRARVPLNL